jgi:hypothetical protein
VKPCLHPYPFGFFNLFNKSEGSEGKNQLIHEELPPQFHHIWNKKGTLKCCLGNWQKWRFAFTFGFFADGTTAYR